jgi:hypothetical protein
MFYLKTKENWPASSSRGIKLALSLGMLHFIKRELESVFIHIFSKASVPVSGSVKNFVHYWVLYGIFTIAEITLFPKEDLNAGLLAVLAVIWAGC